MRTFSRVLMKILVSVTLILGLCDAGFSADIGLVSGVFKIEKNKTKSQNAGTDSLLTIGGRYHDDLNDNTAWYALGLLNLRSYSNDAVEVAPRDSTGVLAGGGLRRYFKPFGGTALPYLYGGGHYANDQVVSSRATGTYLKAETTGLYYGGGVGMRVALDNSFYVELETPLFRSALYETEKTMTNDSTQSESTKYQLYFDTLAPFQATHVAFGMKI